MMDMIDKLIERKKDRWMDRLKRHMRTNELDIEHRLITLDRIDR